jgi:O-antigen ligase
MEAFAVWGMFLTLPIERILVLNVAGFTIRPVYPFMGLLILLNARRLPRAGVAGVVGTAVLLAVFVSAMTTESPRLTTGYALWASFTVLFFVSAVARLRESRELIGFWTRAYVTGAGLWSLFALGQWILSFWVSNLAYSFFGSLPRIHALALEPAFFAFYLIPAFLLSFGTAQYHWTVAGLAAIVLSTSRAGLLGLAVGFAVLMILARRTDAKKVAIAAASAIIAVGLLANFSRGGSLGLSSHQVNKPESILHERASVAPRLGTWSTAWKLFVNNPVDGVGTGAFGGGLHEEGIAVDVPASDLKTTNLWLEVGAEQGLLGIGALLAWIAVGVGGVWRRRTYEELAPFVLAAALASLAMFAFVQTWWVPYRWIVWVIAYSIAFPSVSVAQEASFDAGESPLKNGETRMTTTRRKRIAAPNSAGGSG